MRNSILLILSISLLWACKSDQPKPDTIIQNAIFFAGGDKYEQKKIKFQFREHTYEVSRIPKHEFMSRTLYDSLKTTLDFIDSNGLIRTLNNQRVELPDSTARKYYNSVNSVIYFALLPYKLDDPAVISSYLGEEVIEDKVYHAVGIEFKKEGGGKDFQDKFIYWFDQSDYSLDYLAYSYETDGGGMRFREAFNERFVGGIRFVDYRNYKPKDFKNTSLKELPTQFQNSQLELLSTIKTENIEVK